MRVIDTQTRRRELVVKLRMWGWRVLRRLRYSYRAYLRPGWHRFEWWVVGMAALLALLLGYAGFSEVARASGTPLSGLDLIYRAFQLFTLESGAIEGPVPWQLEVARILAPSAAGYTALQAVLALVIDEVETWRLRFTGDHVVIGGLGRMGYRLATHFAERGERVVAIERDESSPVIEECRERGITVLVGDAAHPPLLEAAGVHRARMLIAVCGEDASNARVAVSAGRLVARPAGRTSHVPLVCTAHITDPQLWHQLGGRDIGQRGDRLFRLQFFSVLDSAARMMLDEWVELASMAPGSTQSPHVVVIGAGALGSNLIGLLARRWWVEQGEVLADGSSRRLAPERRLRLTLVDHHAAERSALLQQRNPGLAQACRLRCEELDVRGAAFAEADFLPAPGAACDVSVIFICFDDDALALATGLRLRDQLRDACPPIRARMSSDEGLAALLAERQNGKDRRLRAFSLLERTCTPEVASGGVLEVVARAMHDAYVRGRLAEGAVVAEQPSMRPWEELAPAYKESNRDQAHFLPVKMEAIGCRLVRLSDWDADLFAFTEAELERLAELEHERFVAERRRHGWSPGPRDDRRKHHPDLIPLSEMGAEQREGVMQYNRAGARVLPRILASVSLQIERG